MKLGDKVQWTSSASGGTRTKCGEIVEVVHPGDRPSREFADLHRQGCGYGRDYESYVVRVKQGKTERSKPRHYWPKAEKLLLV